MAAAGAPRGGVVTGGCQRFDGFRVARPVARRACYMSLTPLPISVKDFVKLISKNVNSISVGLFSAC